MEHLLCAKHVGARSGTDVCWRCICKYPPSSSPLSGSGRPCQPPGGGGPAVSRKCPGLSVTGESKEAEVLVLGGELMANDGGGANRSTWKQ